MEASFGDSDPPTEDGYSAALGFSGPKWGTGPGGGGDDGAPDDGGWDGQTGRYTGPPSYSYGRLAGPDGDLGITGAGFERHDGIPKEQSRVKNYETEVGPHGEGAVTADEDGDRDRVWGDDQTWFPEVPGGARPSVAGTTANSPISKSALRIVTWEDGGTRKRPIGLGVAVGTAGGSLEHTQELVARQGNS
ncbi:hypothetical protein CDD83_4686 [Cordyceps sp. RAO-2017]|nr:hypothetical protein CDD83_4686 [Cordyceps sp. RAO-2017]